MQASPRNHGESKHFFELLYANFTILIFFFFLECYVGGGVGAIILIFKALNGHKRWASPRTWLLVSLAWLDFFIVVIDLSSSHDVWKRNM